MLKRSLRSLAVASLALAATSAANAGETGFSAITLESHPTGGKRTGRIYVLGDATRFDYQRMGLPVIEIALADKGVRRVLFPATRTYMEFLMRLPTGSGGRVPCMANERQVCAVAGEEEIGGVKTEVWELTTRGESEPTRLWWDRSRRLVVREEFPDGRRMQALKRQSADYESVKTEQWELTYMFPGGRYTGGMTIFAPDLGVSVVERRPDGLIRRLTDIRRSGVTADLFGIPDGYRRIELPNPPPPGQSAPAGWQPMSLPAPPRGDGPFAARFGHALTQSMNQGDTAGR